MRRTFVGLVLLACTTPAFADGVVLRDDFSSRASGWPHSTGRAQPTRGFAIYTSDGKYQMTPTRDATIGIALAPRQPPSGNVRIDANLFLFAGVGKGAAGVLCRFRDPSHYYAFVVSGEPGWSIFKVDGARPVELAAGPLPAGGMPGAAEGRLQATCDGDRLALRFNGREVGNARDASLRDGASGLLVMGERTAGTSVTFDDVALADTAR